MTREEAIRILDPKTSHEALLKYADLPASALMETMDEASRIAVAYLRVQQAPAKLDRSRWEGCKFCDREIYIKTTQYLRPALAPATHVEELRYRLADLTGEVYLEAPKKYCWFCGHPLTEEAWAELERRIGGNDGKTD